MRRLSCILIGIMLRLSCFAAKSIFCPLGAQGNCEWELLSLDPVPLGVQYNGYVQGKDKEMQYIFQVDGGISRSCVGKIFEGRFLLQQISQDKQLAIVKDTIEDKLYNLKLGETYFVDGAFSGRLLDKSNGQIHSFTPEKKQIVLPEKTLNITFENPVRIRVVEKKNNLEPFVYFLEKMSEK